MNELAAYRDRLLPRVMQGDQRAREMMAVIDRAIAEGLVWGD
jgi:hypothetical protein